MDLPAGGVAVLESHHASSFAMPFGTWSYHKLCWVSVGSGRLGLEGEELPLERDRFVLLEAGRKHRFVDEPADPLTLVIVCFHPTVMAENAALRKAFAQLGDQCAFARPWCGRNPFLTTRFRDHFRTLLREQARQPRGWEAMLSMRLGQLLIDLGRGAMVGPRPAARGVALLDGVLAYLEDNFREPVEIDRLARRAGVSRRRFTELFRERTGESLVTYVNRLRITYACDRLRETGHIAYSCYEAGFQDMAYFYRVFKKLVGQTPGAFVQAEAGR
ncbi:MAG: helix-turn-helix domain-containing protein [Opitutales bacterium]